MTMYLTPLLNEHKDRLESVLRLSFHNLPTGQICYQSVELLARSDPKSFKNDLLRFLTVKKLKVNSVTQIE